MMKILSTHRKKLEPKRRFGTREFRTKIKQAQNYKRIFIPSGLTGWRKFWLGVGIALFLVLFYFVFLSSEFVIANVQVNGNTQVPTQQIQDAFNQYGQSRFFLMKKTSIFLMSAGRANKMLTTTIPTIKEITSYKRIWPNKLQITVKERTPGFALKSSDNYFLIDDEGVVVKPLDNPGNLLVVEDSIVEDFATNEVLPDAKMAPFVISMSRAWNSKISTGIANVKFPGKGSDEVQFTSTEGWTVFFDLNRSATSELDNLALILSKQISAKDRPNLAYIDLRLSKWAYYCYKDAPCSQTSQPDPTTAIPQLTSPNATK